jgi:hypothetical protein
MNSQWRNCCDRSRSFFLCLFAALVVLFASGVYGQGYFGSVSGTLADKTGAAIAGAKVTLLDQDKGYRFTGISDETGRYLFRSVAPGLYTVIAEAPGFEKSMRTGIRLNVTQNSTANLTMTVASSTESVVVNSQAQLLDIQDATGGLVVNRNFIDSLPLVDRYVMDLAMLTPGVTEADNQSPVSGTGTNFVSNGSRNSTADVLMDGVTVTNMEPNGGVTQVTYMPSSESVEEFRVEQSNFSAEYGFSGASVVNLVTRSGSNEFHGGVYDYIRNKITDSNTWFNNYNGIALPPVHRNNYGGTFGGPIWRNKTFFFVDYSGTRSSTAYTYEAGVPTTEERTSGDFGAVCTTQGGSFDSNGQCSVASGQIWDPYTGTYGTYTDPNSNSTTGAVRSAYIPYNKIGDYASPGNSKLTGTGYELGTGKGNLIDPVAKKMMNLYPTPTASMASPTIYYNWTSSGANHTVNDQFDIKIDHRFNQKNLLSAKYSQESDSTEGYNCYNSYIDPCGGGPNHSHAHLFSLNDVHTFSPTMLLTTVFGFTRGSERISAYNGDGGVTDPLSSLGFPSYLNSNGFMGVPAIYLSENYYTASNSLTAGNNPYGNYKEGQSTAQLSISLDKVHGNFDTKFGFEGRQHQMNYIQTNAPNGDFTFSRTGTSACPAAMTYCGGDAMASFMMGNMSYATYEIQDQPATEDHQFAGYGQENWKVNRNLTINVGLRYDITLPRSERFNRQNWFDPTATLPLTISGMGTLYGGEVFASSKQRHIVNTDWHDIQPRFGIAYQINSKTVARGGYGIYYSQSRAGVNGVAPYGAQGYNQWTSAITTYQDDGATPYLHLSNPFPSGLTKPSGNTLGLMNDVGTSATGPFRSMTNTPYEQSWSLGIERQVPWNIFLSATYNGKKGTHLYFSGANWINHLGSGVESYSSSQMADLTNMVSNPFYGTITDSNSALSSSTIEAYLLDLPYPQFPGGVSTEAWPVANSIYHGLQLEAEKRYSNGMQFLVSYVWSKSIDNASVGDDNTTWLGGATSLQNPNNLKAERSLSSFDIPSVFQLSYLYELPIGRGKALFNHMPEWLDAIVGEWQTNGIWRVSSGRPLCFTTSDGTAIPSYGTQRPNITGKLRRAGGKDSDWINGYFANASSVLSLPDSYTLGNMSRTTAMVRTPLGFSSNLSMQKIFMLDSLHKGLRAEMRLEAENALNHPVFGDPDVSLDDSSFGEITSTANNPRQVQLSVKIKF